MKTQTEVWLRGEKIPGLALQLQPAADALLQAKEELQGLLNGFPDALLWERPAGVASVGFHLKHIAGFLDRLLTYAEGNALTKQQLETLKSEIAVQPLSLKQLLENAVAAIDQTISRYKNFPEAVLTEARKVGRAGLPSTVIGLCFHAAEHTMRHTGQLLVTTAVLKGRS
ncbi:DinB family protein [Niabella ginsenosidivorans]|nr:DinB family protein [Niabella ginsenosidivorans]